MTTIIIPDSLRKSVEGATCGHVTVLYDDKGFPSYMRIIPKFNCEDIDASLGTGVHPAFIVDGVEKSELFIGQYPAIIRDSRAMSLPGMDPISNINFDNARAACAAKGPGWHLLSNWEWAAIALLCVKNGTEPRGNTYYGRHHDQTHEQGRRQDGLAPGISSIAGRTLTGSGPAAWRHDNTIAGICDIVGNIWKWVDGLKLVDGSLFMPNDNNVNADEADWVNQGVIIADDSGTTKLGTAADTAETAGSNTFGAWSAITGTSNFNLLGEGVRQRLHQALILPLSTNNPGGTLYYNTDGEMIPRRSGSCSSAASAGLGSLNLHYTRSSQNTNIGFFPAFVF